MGNMRRHFKITVDFQKEMYKKITILISQDVCHYICRVRDSEHNKKETLLYSIKIVGLVID